MAGERLVRKPLVLRKKCKVELLVWGDFVTRGRVEGGDLRRV